MTEFVPEWAKRAVWYQIFPDRFRNGDPANDPTLESIRGAYPHDLSDPWQVQPWTSDWYALQSYERANGHDVWHNLLRRRYGGDLQGILDRLDYIQELGANSLYLNPVFTAPSAHKYDGATYHHVDPHLGPDPGGDLSAIQGEEPTDPATWVWTAADRLLLELIAEVHRRGMRIILDGVFNHVGINHWAYRDLLEHGRESPYAEWFDVQAWPDESDDGQLVVTKWWDVPELPEWREDENGTVAGPRDYIFAITRRWMDPHGNNDLSAGIDGWRLDVAACVKHPFWKAWRTLVRSINPEAYLVAELVDPIEAVQPYLQGDEFDAAMNYDFLFTVDEFFVRRKRRITASAFDSHLRRLREAFPDGVSYVMQNLLSSHDSERFVSHCANRDIGHYRNWAGHHSISKGSNPAYNTGKPDNDAVRIHKLCVIFQMTYLGAPMVYYGDEVGMWGANDPCCRKPMVWDDLSYEPETCLPDQSRRSVEAPVAPDHDILDHYRRLLSIRRDHPALQVGDFTTLLTDDKHDCYAYSRRAGDDLVIVVLNNSDRERHVHVPAPVGKYRDLLNEEEVRIDASPGEITVEKKWGRVISPV